MGLFLEMLLINTATAFLLAIVVWLFATLPVLRNRPKLRHCLWILVLFKLVTPPLVELAILPDWNEKVGSRGNPIDTLEPNESQNHVRNGDAPTKSQSRTTDLGEVSDQHSQANPIASVTKPSETEQGVTANALSDHAAFHFNWSLIIVWIVGSLMFIGYVFSQVVRLQKAIRLAGVIDATLSDKARQIGDGFGINRATPVYLVNSALTPFLWVAWSGPKFVLSRSLIEQLNEEQLECILAHEMAHYVRRDHLTNTMSLLFVAVFWWNPVAWWARREMKMTQEACCDALAISRPNTSRKVYADTLFQVMDFLNSERTLSPALASRFVGTSSPQWRFEMIASNKVSHKLPWWSYPVLATMVAILPLVPTPVVGQLSETRSIQEAPQSIVQYRTSSRQLRVPVTLDDESRKLVRSFELFASTDAGANWSKVATCPSDGKFFDFEVMADGKYWLALEVALILEDPNPVATIKCTPEMLVIVDTSNTAQIRKTIRNSTKLGVPTDSSGNEAWQTNPLQSAAAEATTAAHNGIPTNSTPTNSTPSDSDVATSSLLDGTWQLRSMTIQGFEIQRENASSSWMETFEQPVSIQGDHIQHGQSSSVGEVVVNETTFPKQITVFVKDELLEFRGIYEVDGEQLSVCINGNGKDRTRPSEFVSGPGTANVLLKLQKVSQPRP